MGPAKRALEAEGGFVNTAVHTKGAWWEGANSWASQERDLDGEGPGNTQGTEVDPSR